MFTEVLISCIGAYIVWKQQFIESALADLKARLDKLENYLPRRKNDV